jgi:hypothetical membrane protein
VDGRRQLTAGQAERSRPGAWTQAGALGGLAGPIAFTAAWIVASLLQPGEQVFAVQISGLAAENARYPWIMITGFLLLGAGAITFGTALRHGLGGWPESGPAPAVIQAAGVLTIAAGLLRRDHLLLADGPESWHNHAHDVISAAAYVLMVAAPVLLARRLRPDPRWRVLTVPIVVAATVSAAMLVVFYALPHQTWDGLLQRTAVSLPLAAIAAVSVRLLVLTRRVEDNAAGVSR